MRSPDGPDVVRRLGIDNDEANGQGHHNQLINIKQSTSPRNFLCNRLFVVQHNINTYR